jgi:hypothetical protein
LQLPFNGGVLTISINITLAFAPPS